MHGPTLCLLKCGRQFWIVSKENDSNERWKIVLKKLEDTFILMLESKFKMELEKSSTEIQMALKEIVK